MLLRLAAADPGLMRLQRAAETVLAMVGALVIVAVAAGVGGRHPQEALVFTAVLSMLASGVVNDARLRDRLVTLAGVPFAAGTGVVLACAVGTAHRARELAFIPIAFAAIWMRRFGPRFSGYGFLLWLGYFLAVLVRASWGDSPQLLGAATLTAEWLALLFVTVLREHPDRSLARIERTFRLRGQLLAVAAMAVLETESGSGRRARALRSLRRRLLQLNETALLIEGLLSHSPTAAAPERTAGQVRSQLFGEELSHQALADAIRAAAVACPRRLTDPLIAPLSALAVGDLIGARGAAVALRSDTATATRTLCADAVDRVVAAMLEVIEATGRPGAAPERGAEPFAATVGLVGRRLPGTAAVLRRALDQRASTGRSGTRLDLTTRQAIQVAVATAAAVTIGSIIDARHYYWALIAVFVTFAGTTTTAETTRRGAARVLGTVAGLFVAVGLAELTAGHPRWALALSAVAIFAGFYLQDISYAALIFFITIVLAQLYTLLGTFTEGLFVTRLAETAAGAVIGIAVARLVLPTGTRTAARAARRALFTDVAELLEASADRVDGVGAPDLLAAARRVDESLRQYAAIAAPLGAPRLVPIDNTSDRRVAAIALIVARTRALAEALTTEGAAPELAEPLRLISGAAAEIAAHPVLRPDPSVTEACTRAGTALSLVPPGRAVRIAAELAKVVPAALPAPAPG